MISDLKDTNQPTKQLKICFVGNFSQYSVGEPEVAKSLEELGHKVFRLLEFSTSLKKIKRIIVENRCDLLLFSKLRVGNVSEEFIKSLPCPSVCWLFDLMFNIDE